MCVAILTQLLSTENHQQRIVSREQQIFYYWSLVNTGNSMSDRPMFSYKSLADVQLKEYRINIIKRARISLKKTCDTRDTWRDISRLYSHRMAISLYIAMRHNCRVTSGCNIVSYSSFTSKGCLKAN